ncbi:hypothetical protein BCR34DRAFT_194453 [Clohesyomyces aquaticus]|uniref:Uncharacterized protein n=1 Tax=Clohesyomyces aquaticus TaxID=1231657 RepID=A0A1Y1YC34_9PLEO|nr:hypothetical protein BCR34DRAFT_194453 [Clohesyomyces aquaticus]
MIEWDERFGEEDGDAYWWRRYGCPTEKERPEPLFPRDLLVEWWKPDGEYDQWEARAWEEHMNRRRERIWQRAARAWRLGACGMDRGQEDHERRVIDAGAEDSDHDRVDAGADAGNGVDNENAGDSGSDDDQDLASDSELIFSDVSSKYLPGLERAEIAWEAKGHSPRDRRNRRNIIWWRNITHILINPNLDISQNLKDAWI